MTIQELIKASGLTQAAFAEKFHIPKRTVEDWATGKRTPPSYVPYLIELLESDLISRTELDKELEKAQKNLESDDDVIWERNKKYFKGLVMARQILRGMPSREQ